MEFRFYAVDEFDAREILCESDNLMDCYNAVLKRFEDTDGECDCHIEDTMTEDNFSVGVFGWYCDEEEVD